TSRASRSRWTAAGSAACSDAQREASPQTAPTHPRTRRAWAFDQTSSSPPPWSCRLPCPARLVQDTAGQHSCRSGPAPWRSRACTAYFVADPDGPWDTSKSIPVGAGQSAGRGAGARVGPARGPRRGVTGGVAGGGAEPPPGGCPSGAPPKPSAFEQIPWPQTAIVPLPLTAFRNGLSPSPSSPPVGANSPPRSTQTG